VAKPTYIDVKNLTNVGRWWSRWKMLGGSFFAPPRPMQDLRNEEDLRRYREIEFKRRHTPYGDAAIVNLAAWRMRRARRQAAG
jgi:hypothetical protein